MRTALFSLGGLAFILGASAAPATTPAKSAYGPQMKPAAFEPRGNAPKPIPKHGPSIEPQRPYERAVEEWKYRQYRCMKKGRVCLENRPLPSDLLETPHP